MSDKDDKTRAAKKLAIQRIKDAADFMTKGIGLMVVSAFIINSAWEPTHLYLQVPAFIGGVILGLFAVKLCIFGVAYASLAFYPWSGEDPKKIHEVLEYVVAVALSLSIFHMVYVQFSQILGSQ
jgi:hypothetical protein